MWQLKNIIWRRVSILNPLQTIIVAFGFGPAKHVPQPAPHEPLLHDLDLGPGRHRRANLAAVLAPSADADLGRNVLGALEIQNVEEKIAHSQRFFIARLFEAVVEDVITGTMRFRVGMIVSDSVIFRKSLDFDWTMVVSPLPGCRKEVEPDPLVQVLLGLLKWDESSEFVGLWVPR